MTDEKWKSVTGNQIASMETDASKPKNVTCGDVSNAGEIQAALNSLFRLENDALSSRDGYGYSSGDAEIIRRVIMQYAELKENYITANQHPYEELLEALKAAKWKGEPSGNPEKGWVTTATGKRFTSLGSRKMYGKFLDEHNKQLDYIIARAEQKGQSHE